MDNKSEKINIKDAVLHALDDKKITMQSRGRFWLVAIACIFGAVVSLIGLITIVSFILFAIRESGLLFAPSFGPSGWVVFIRSFPWILLFISILFLIFLESLMRRYVFVYRKPIIVSVAVFVIVASMASVLAAPLHRDIYRSLRTRKTPVMHPFYERFGREQFRDVHPGRIFKINGRRIILRNPLGATSSVHVASTTEYDTSLKENDPVIIFGEGVGNTIEAHGIKKIDYRDNEDW